MHSQSTCPKDIQVTLANLEANSINSRFISLGPALRPPTTAARAFAAALLDRIVTVKRTLTLVEVCDALATTHGHFSNLTPAEGDALNAALAELTQRIEITGPVAQAMQAVCELVFIHFPNPFKVYD